MGIQIMSFYKTLQWCRLLRMLLLLSSALSVSGCDLIFDSIIDCIDDDRPEIRGELPSPVLNQYYDEGVSVSIRNEPYDDKFIYSYDFSGSLPEGIQIDIDDRSFRLIGTPIETGEYQFSISVKVEDSTPYSNDLTGDTEGLCSTSDSENFRWSVRVM